MNRLVLFSFYDPKGIVDDYVLYLLRSFSGIAEEICTVVNGFLTPESEQKLKKISKVLIRENKGLDAWGYKYGLEYYGYEKIATYDELICLNHTCFGPIFPWKDMFQKMEKVSCDWWSLFRDHCPDNFVPGDHLPSYFIVYRQSLLKQKAFREFWDTMPEINTYEEDVRFYENRQTPFFDKRGLTWAVAFDLSRFDSRSDNWPLNCTKEMLIEDHLPLLKRRPFFVINGQPDLELYSIVFPFISEKTDYDLNLIIQNLKRTQDFNSIKRASCYQKIIWKIKSVLNVKNKRLKYKSKIENESYLIPLIQLLKGNSDGQ